jgi:cell division protein FtsI (penicillin-binding protein 3)
MVTAAAALAGNVFDPGDLIDCELGGITLAGTRIRDHKPFGWLSFRDVIARSSNVGAIKIGLRVGPERLERMVRGLGFGERTGIDLPGESPGLLRPAARWTLRGAYVAFGQEISITPLQLAVAFAAVANGGTRVRPYLVASATGPGGERIVRPRPQVEGRPLSDGTARELERILEAVVAEGTGRAAAISGYPVAGKTGTAQKAVDGLYSGDRFVASFVGFAPARRPAVVGAVVIDEPKPLYHGGQVAAPAFAAMVAPALLYLGVPPERERPEPWPGQRQTQIELAATRSPAAPPPSPGEDTW